jgi:uncharacterized membrane protein
VEDQVATLVVLGFADMATADEAALEIEDLNREKLLSLIDWARVIRRPDGTLDVRQGNSTTGVGAMGGTLGGALFGILFLMPIAGAVVGGVLGALGGKLADVGIDDGFIHGLGKQIQPGTSALFVYVHSAEADQVTARMRRFDPELLSTSLPDDAEARLEAALRQTDPV